jgi:zinc transport system substrate-binding protein
MKTQSAAAAILMGLFLLTGCVPAVDNSYQDGKLKIITSFYVMYDFACKIGGDKVVVTNLTPTGVEPHDWEPTPSDIISMEKADLFIYNGMDMERWVESVLSALGNKDLIVVEASADLAQQISSEETHSISPSDPHVWLDPILAKYEMKAIYDAITAADPENSEYYAANYEAYAEQFDLLDEEFTQALSSLPQRNIVVAHDAFGYLCNAYDLTQIPIEGLQADSEPDAARMAEIIDYVRDNDVKVIFFEELVSPKVANTIADEAGCTTAVLNPLEGLSDEALASGGDYFSVMRANMNTLVSALT